MTAVINMRSSDTYRLHLRRKDGNITYSALDITVIT